MRTALQRYHWLITAVVAAVIAAATILLMPSLDTAGTVAMSTAGVMLALMRFVVAIAAVFIVLRVLDLVCEFDWNVISDEIEANPRAAAVYLGLRFLAVAWIAGSCFS